MQPVPELVPLRLEVAPVLGRRVCLDRNLLDDREAKALDSGQLLGVVREDADRRQAEVGEDLVADSVLARVGR
jgi:hypothetical protein